MKLADLPRATAGRDKLVTASEVAAVLGFSPWQTPLQVWRRKQGRAGGADTVYTRAGNAGEIVLRDWYARNVADGDVQPGLSYSDVPIAGPRPWMAASPDAMAQVYPFNSPIVVEFKTSGQAMDSLPPYYRSQCDWLLACIPAPAVELVAAVEMPERLRALLGSTDPHEVAAGQTAFGAMLDAGVVEVRRFTVERDHGRIAALIAQVEEWHDAHMLAGFPPSPQAGDADFVAATFAVDPDPQFDEATLARLVSDYREAKAALDAAESAADVAKAALLLGLEAAGVEEAKTSGGKVSFKAQAGRASVDQKALQVGWPDVYAKVAKVGSPFRVLRVGK
jgi:predicted phage-related endonuclease